MQTSIQYGGGDTEQVGEGQIGGREVGTAAKRLREKPSRLERTENKICLLGENIKNKTERRESQRKRATAGERKKCVNRGYNTENYN